MSESGIDIYWKINFEVTLNFQKRVPYYFDDAFMLAMSGQQKCVSLI